ncbi:hypothetical protein Trco_000174 [Trichoderma cornu-damae]|uniref:NACHT domain-containing protein n=1 Tax=Trichoderma cornu-damae TaxID=654480 RepID=A0A9P8QRW2_9HYPO|nr:hypothetical protein Trco_000174 [Trichoderma cornu-damae]
MELLARSDVFFGSGMIKQTLNAILRPEQASGLVSELLKMEQKVSLEVQSCEASRSARTGKKIDERIESLLTRLNELSLPLTRIDEGVAELLEKMEKRELEKMMDFISSEQFGKGHAAIKDKRTKYTGDWLMNHEGFLDWQAIASSSTLLCLKGTVGTGKTYLTSRVIDHVKERFETSAHDEGFAYFYCNRSGPSMQDPLVILRSFVRQLSYRACDYERIQSSLIRRELILESLNLYSKTTIILDALDESDIRSYNLAEILIDMMEKAEKPVKIFISSRPDRGYLKAFEATCTITVDSSSQQGDIEKFLHEQLYSKPFFLQQREEIRIMIEETFRLHNGGMFRWVYLRVQHLRKCISDDAIKAWAETVPPDLMKAYDQLWKDMNKDHGRHDMALAERAIKWVLCSLEPLRSDVFLEAIRYAFDGDAMDLLTIDKEWRVWMLPHASVAEYFESRGMILGECDVFAAVTSLHYLMTFDWKPIRSRYQLGITFEEYVAYRWVEHVQRYDRWLGSTEGAEADPKLVATLKRFLGSPGESSDYYREELKPENMALFVVCRYGVYYTLRDWWDKGQINEEMALKENNGYVNSLAVAVESGCMPICRYLASVMDVNNPLAEGHQEAFRRALKKEDREMMSFLVVEAKVDVNYCYDGYEETAAQYVAAYRPDMLRWFVGQGWVDVNREGGKRWGTALIAAANIGSRSLESVEILLDAGADVNAAVECGKYGTALVAAVMASPDENYTKMIRALLDRGADANQPLKVGRDGSALEALLLYARGNRVYREGLDLLLEAGADPAIVFDRGEHGSALAAAACYGEKDFLEDMIDVTGEQRAIECLGQSRRPSGMRFVRKEDIENWKRGRAETRAYLTDQVGVDKETLYKIGLGDVKLEGMGYIWDVYVIFDDSLLYDHQPELSPDTEPPTVDSC